MRRTAEPVARVAAAPVAAAPVFPWHALAERRLDRAGERPGLTHVASLRRLPRNDLDLAAAAADDGKGLGIAARCRACVRAESCERQIEHLRAGDRGTNRRARVQADE